MQLDLELPCETINEDKLEAGSRVPPGWYRANILDIYPDSKHPFLKIEMEVLAGPFKGSKIFDSLWDPEESGDADRAQAAQNRLLLISRRIGAREAQSGSISFVKAIGREVVVHVTQRKDSPFANVAFDGIYPLDHEKLSDDVRKTLGIKVPKQSGNKSSSASSGDQGSNHSRLNVGDI